MKKVCIIIVAVVVFIGLSVTTVLAATTDLFKPKVDKENAEQWLQDQERKKRELYYGTNMDFSPEKDMFESAYAVADDSQRKALDGIKKEEVTGSVGTYNKQILVIMNKLPEDVSNITLNEVKEICAEAKDKTFESKDELNSYFMNEFDKIAGAADFVGGSGITRIIYFLDAEHVSYIQISSGHVTYFPKFGENGESLFPSEE